MNSRLVARAQLTPRQRDAMFALLGTHFDNVDRDVFEADLQEKNWVILLEDAPSGGLMGFSTLLLYATRFRNEPMHVVCSGDTIVAPGGWQSMKLGPAWIGGVNRLRRELATPTLHWLLLTSGFRTYRFLPVFWRQFYPRYDRPTPAHEQAIMQALAVERFGSRFDVESGVVRFDKPQVLAAHLADVPDGRRRDPNISFFLQANPGHVRGDELVCYTQLNRDNLTRTGVRVWQASDRLYDQTPSRWGASG